MLLEECALKTPLEPGVALEMKRLQPGVPELSVVEDGIHAFIYLTKPDGLPLWWPASGHRRHRSKFRASWLVSVNLVTNTIRAKNAAVELKRFAKRKLDGRKAGLKASRTRRARGVELPGPGRVKGIKRSMERGTGINTERNCRRGCGGKAHKGTCRIPEERA